jgi:branched-chain amino acid transport system substrate-binding protein
MEHTMGWPIKRLRNPATLAIFGAVLCASALLSSCADHRPITVGLAGSFSGRDSTLGVSGRNAAELFVKQINDAGGLRGRKIRLEIRDFASDPARIVAADRELLDAGAVAIVGHFTSASAVAALDFANRERVCLVCPTASAESLGGKKDYLFRTIMSSSRDASAIAADMAASGAKRLLIIQSSDNKPYAETYTAPLAKAVEIADDLSFGDIRAIDYARAARARADAILIIANPIDTGSVAQELRIRGIDKPLYLSGFATTSSEDLIASGGSAVEGARFFHQVDETQPGLAPLIGEYRRVYGTKPDYAAMETWDAMCLVKTVLESGGLDRASFHEKIGRIRSFQGTVGRISLDEFGDATRELFMLTIKGGQVAISGRIG